MGGSGEHSRNSGMSTRSQPMKRKGHLHRASYSNWSESLRTTR